MLTQLGRNRRLGATLLFGLARTVAIASANFPPDETQFTMSTGEAYENWQVAVSSEWDVSTSLAFMQPYVQYVMDLCLRLTRYSVHSPSMRGNNTSSRLHFL